MNDLPVVSWIEAGKTCSALWRSESGVLPPRRVVIGEDTLSADTAFRLACAGTAVLWRGDFNNARQLLKAISRRVEASIQRADPDPSSAPPPITEAFLLQRRRQAMRAHVLGMLLVPIEGNYEIDLSRAPDVREACREAYGPGGHAFVVSLRELLGLVGAHEWRTRGVVVPELHDRIHPHYGVFSPIRGEYVTLVAAAPLGHVELAFDVGTGTGVLAAVLARRGVPRVVATEHDERAIACARENVARLGLSARVDVIFADLFPAGVSPLIVCNPPWIPARPTSRLESAVYEDDGRMLSGYISGLAGHLAPGGEGWLILSDIAERLGLRTRAELLEMIDAAGLDVVDRLDERPHHRKSQDAADPLHAARAAEITSLWRLAARHVRGS